jgi:hypothetical protein
MYSLNILCINLKSRADRLEAMKEEFTRMKLNFERFDAITDTNGALGCTKSHIECIRLAKQRNYHLCMICEDDFRFSISRKNFDKIVQNFVDQHHSHILILSGNTDTESITNFDNVFYRTTSTLTTTCYIVKKRYYETLLKNFMISEKNLQESKDLKDKNEYALDVTWKLLQKSDVWLIPKVFCGYQMSSYSDIEKKEVNYENLFRSIYQNNFIKIDLEGGLGNRLFQVAFGYSLSRKTNKVLLLCDNRINTHSNVDYSTCILKKFLNYEDSVPIHAVRNEKKNRALVYDPSLLSNSNNNIEVYGYFQNEMYFKDFAEELRYFFVDKTLCESLKQKYPNITNSVFIHVRRTDYLSQENINIHYVDLNKYYQACIQYVKEKYSDNVLFHIFSDDIDYCKDYTVFNNINKVFVSGENEINCLYLMSLCKLGGICCNSSFSWWGSYLNDNSEKLVFFPNKWFGKKSAEKYTDLGFSGAYFVDTQSGELVNGNKLNRNVNLGKVSGKYNLFPTHKNNNLFKSKSNETQKSDAVSTPRRSFTPRVERDIVSTPRRAYTPVRNFTQKEQFIPTTPTRNFIQKEQFIPTTPTRNFIQKEQFIPTTPTRNFIQKEQFIPTTPIKNFTHNEQLFPTTPTRNFMQRDQFIPTTPTRNIFPVPPQNKSYIPISPRRIPAEQDIDSTVLSSQRSSLSEKQKFVLLGVLRNKQTQRHSNPS